MSKSDAKTHRTAKALRAKSRQTPAWFCDSFGSAHCLPAVCGRPLVAFAVCRYVTRIFNRSYSVNFCAGWTARSGTSPLGNRHSRC